MLTLFPMLVNACLVNFSSISAKAVSLIKKHITYSDLRKTTNVSTPNCLLTLSDVSLLVHVSWITAEVFLLITKPTAQEDMAFISKHEKLNMSLIHYSVLSDVSTLVKYSSDTRLSSFESYS